MGHANSKDDFSAEYIHIDPIKHTRCKCTNCRCACRVSKPTDPEPERGQPAVPDCPDLDSLKTDTSSETSYDEAALPQSSSWNQLNHFPNITGVGNRLEDHVDPPLRRPSSLSLSMNVLIASNPSLSDSTSSQPYSPLSASAYLFGMGGQFQTDPSSGMSSTYLTAASHLSNLSSIDPFIATEYEDGTFLAAAVQEQGTKVTMGSYVFRPLRLVPEDGPLRLVPEHDFW